MEPPGPVLATLRPVTLLLLLSALTRLPTLHFSVIDWDESLYFLMAEQWRAGRLPYTALWDNKPVGIYAIVAGFQTIFGDGIASLRIAGMAATGATACLLFFLGRRLISSRGRWQTGCALLGGVLFVLSSVPDGGLASNAELFMMPFVCLGMMAVLGAQAELRPGATSACLAGLCFGVACMVKYVAVFDSAAAFLVIAAIGAREHGFAGKLAQSCSAFTGGMAAPLVAALALYWLDGQLETFLQASMLSYLRRGAVPLSPSHFLRTLGEQVRLFPLLYLAAASLIAQSAADVANRPTLDRRAARTNGLLLAWMLADVVGATSGAFYYRHYFLQLLPVLCLTAAVMASRMVARMPALAPSLPAAILALAILAHPFAVFGRTVWPILPGKDRATALHDTPAEIARDLQPLLTADGVAAADEVVYVFDYQPIIYALLDIVPPTRYALPSFLISRFMSYVAGVDPERELAAIMGRRPAFVIRARVAPNLSGQAVDLDLYREMDRVLAADYRVWRRYQDAIVYRRIGM